VQGNIINFLGDVADSEEVRTAMLTIAQQTELDQDLTIEELDLSVKKIKKIVHRDKMV
jgi:hypothetical protein